ncbi:HK97 family phage prohead protease [Mesorhizobium sp. AaZ16]|uniref:HK97 family phage prohead protease n=1 Tax=Mesorhizobium sp. AaZ16 TaxID=3402289 RepID=UPI00374F8AA4
MNAEQMAGFTERKFVGLALDKVDEDGIFAGYASLFGRVDLGKDLVEHGAFAKSLKTRSVAGIRMLFQHDPAEPIGAWTELKEDARGLHVRGRLNTDVARAREVLSLMRGGALDGLSIGFSAVRTKRDPATGVRRIIEAELWEISVVTFPMLPGARIDTVKGRPRPAFPDFERWVRRQTTLARLDAGRAATKGGFPNGRLSRAETSRRLAERIRAAARMINKRGSTEND